MEHRDFVVMTDSACDLPYDLAEKRGIDIMNFGITVDGKAYTEREDFNFEQYYDILRTCEGVPSTAHITTTRYLERFEQYAAQGKKELLYVSICASGSATNDAAQLAKRQFTEENPESAMRIHIVDSHAYSMGYGWFVAEAARRLDEGTAMDDIIPWLEDAFSRVEILLAAYSLKFIKKSGRVSAAAAFAGELLGLRPIISLNDGESIVQRKVRGDKEVLPALADYAQSHMAGAPEYLVGGTNEAQIEELARLCTEQFGTPPCCHFKLGAAVATNTGPDAIAIVYMGAKRKRA